MNFLLLRTPRKERMAHLSFVLIGTLLLTLQGCKLIGESPSEVVEAAYMAANRGEYSEAEHHLSSEALNAMKGTLGILAGGMKEVWDRETKNGSIDRIEIVGEQIRGEGAAVYCRFHYKDGSTKDSSESLIKENGVWKITIGTPPPLATPGATVRPSSPARQAPSPTQRLAEGLAGVWKNQDTNTSGVTKLEIKQEGTELIVHAWGRCQPEDCDWGTEKGILNEGIATVVWNTGFATEKMVLSIDVSQRLHMVLDTVFKDNRPSYRMEEVFVRPQ